MNKLYAASSITERGTLSQLKNDFNHRNVSTDVMKSFNYTDNFIRFTTEAHVVYLLLQLYESRDAAADTLDNAQLLSELSTAAVNQLWSLPSAHSVAELLDGKADDSYITDKWCGCGTGCAHNVSIWNILYDLLLLVCVSLIYVVFVHVIFCVIMCIFEGVPVCVHVRKKRRCNGPVFESWLWEWLLVSLRLRRHHFVTWWLCRLVVFGCLSGDWEFSILLLQPSASRVTSRHLRQRRLYQRNCISLVVCRLERTARSLLIALFITPHYCTWLFYTRYRYYFVYSSRERTR